MPRLSIEDLKKIRDDARQTRTIRSGVGRARITVHMGTCGISAGAREVMVTLLKEIELSRITDVIVTASDCAGMCKREPMATVETRGSAPVRYGDLKPEKIVRILKEHVMEGRIVTEFVLAGGRETTV